MTDSLWNDADIISVYRRKQAITDGVLVDMTEWASADKGFIGGFTVPVAMTAAVWAKCQVPKDSLQSARGRAHDVLWMASLAVRAGVKQGKGQDGEPLHFVVRLGRRNERLQIRFSEHEGFTIGFPQDF